MAAYQTQRRLAFAASAKLDYLEHLLFVHRSDRAILFTQTMRPPTRSRGAFCCRQSPPTKVKERSAVLAGLFGRHLLGRGHVSRAERRVDVRSERGRRAPGSGSVREHVQSSGASCGRKKASARSYTSWSREDGERSPAIGGASTVLTADLVNAGAAVRTSSSRSSMPRAGRGRCDCGRAHRSLPGGRRLSRDELAAELASVEGRAREQR